MNKEGAERRKHIVFINADRDYREGKAQNFLRAEDISRIVRAYRTLTARSPQTFATTQKQQQPTPVAWPPAHRTAAASTSCQAMLGAYPSARSGPKTSTVISGATSTTRHLLNRMMSGHTSTAACP